MLILILLGLKMRLVSAVLHGLQTGSLSDSFKVGKL